MLWERGATREAQARAKLQLGLPVDFPEKYRAGIVKAMELCAVKKNIENPPEFTTEILV
jgi:ribosomal protein S12 methylthiotransferase accessory factor